jgi:hypothetical protein
MDKKLFKRLVESMGQMDEIVRGVRAPSREFYVDCPKGEGYSRHNGFEPTKLYETSSRRRSNVA